MESKSIRHISCSNCPQTFSVRDPLHPRGLRCPLILHCGHTVCENCIRTCLRSTDKVVCGICKRLSTASHQHTDIRLDFPLNLYLLGIFAARYGGTEPEDSVVKFAASSASSCNQKASAQKETCAECVERTAECRCHQCDVLYCDRCFTKVHKAARALSQHKKTKLEEAGKRPAFLQSVCEDHPLQKLEFFCKACSHFMCSHCIISLHHSHEIITKKQRNEEVMVELDDARDKATEVLKRLLHTQKKVREILIKPGPSSKLTPVEQEVAHHFVYLHGLLQIVEQGLMNELKCAKTERSHSLESVVTELSANIKHVQQLLQEAASAKDPDNLDKVELSTIAEKLLAVEQLCIHLVASDRSNADTSARFVVDESFLADVEGHCQLEINTGCSYSLVKSEDLPPDFVLDPIEEDSESDAVMSMSSRTSSVSASSEAMLPSIEQAEPDQKHHTTSSASSSIVKGSSNAVTVCHIRDPSDFYVQRVSDAGTLINLCKQICKHVRNYKTPPHAVHKDGLYVVQYQVDGKWYRARVRNILPACEKTNEELVDVVYVDYGNTEIIPSTKLRSVPRRSANTPAMALHCSLFDLVPLNGKWSQEAVKTFAAMVNGYTVKMVVMDHSSDIYQVDLCQIHGNSQDNDVPVSVRDALVFLEYGCFVAETKLKVSIPQGSTQYLKDADFKKGDTEDVVVSHIESPHSFYIQRLGEHARYLTLVMKDMNTEYRNAGNKGLVYSPYVGMPCAAQFTVDNKWYRAKVVDLPGKRMVEVFYIDYGNQEVMDWNRIRKIQTKFVRIAAQAVHCSLSDVVPTHQQWIAAVREYLIKTTAKKVLRLYVDEVQKLQLKVTLYEMQADVDICINALLVREGYATSVGVSSSLVEYHKGDGVLPPSPPCSIQQTQLKLKKKPVANIKPRHAGGTADVAASGQSKEDTCESVKDPFRLEVKVLNSPSPSCFYVALLVQEEQIHNLMCELQEYYATSASYADTWEVNNKCCAFSAQLKQWYRAIIVELLPDNKAKVFLKDIAEVEIVPLHNLQLLDPKFMAIRDGAVKCHLAGVRAAGDKTEWPSLACEYLNEQITRYPHFYITKKGEIENWSLPVELWVKEVKPVGPFEPTREEWYTLNKKLVEQGLAIPVREFEVQSISSLQVLKELEEQSQGADENSISHWLLLSAQKEEGHKTESSDDGPDVNCGSSVSDVDSEAEREQGEEPLPPALSDWLPPEPVRQNKFLATPTYVDDDCFVYLHDTEKSADTLTVIGNALLSRFQNSQPKPHDLYWFVGQLCIAQYHSDKKWYRGKVVGVNDDRTVKVVFVDYGNVEECKATEMRKNVYMGHIPVQCYKCVLDGVKPASEDGKWPVTTLDFIHTTIVEKQCQVTLKQEPKEGQPPVISLLGPGNIDIAELLVRMQFAIYSSPSDFDMTPKSDIAKLDKASDGCVEDEEEPEVIIENEVLEVTIEDDDEDATVDEEKIEKTIEGEELTIFVSEGPNEKDTENNERNVNDVSSQETHEHTKWNDVIDQAETKQKLQESNTATNVQQYKPLDLPHSDTIFVTVTAILSATELVMQPCKVNESELWELHEEFERMTEDLQKQAQFQSLVKRPYVGQPCCAQYTEDAQWYRATVLAVESQNPRKTLLKIQYVDYGNIECHPSDRVHILKPEWAAIPVQALHCRMWRIRGPDDFDPKTLFPKLMECVSRPPLLAKIKARQPLLEVELFTSDGSELILQPLLDAGLLTLEKEEP